MVEESIIKPHYGEVLTEKLLESFAKEYPRIRVKKPGYMYTQDYVIGRMNIIVDAENIITGHGAG